MFIRNVFEPVYNGPDAEKLKKKFPKLFKDKGLHIIAQYDLKITNYLHIALSLNNG